MFFRLAILLLLVTICGYAEDQLPFPQSQIDGKILDKYYPLVMAEVEKEFALQNDGRTRRCTREYGYSFFDLENGGRTFTPAPKFFYALGKKICKKLGHPPQTFTNIILSLYEEGFSLEPHVDINATDHSGKNYYFDENVYGIIIEADPTGHLYFVRDDVNMIPPLDLEPIYSLKEQQGTIFCLQGMYRKAPYFHGVTRVSHRRISITFRNVLFR